MIGSPKKSKIAIAAIFKNEGPYILEWLAFHRAMGVENFIIAENGSSDGSLELLSALQNLGIVTFMPYQGTAGSPPQLSAYSEILGRYKESADWLAFIDADEFIFPSADCNSIPDFLGIVDEHIGAIALNWATYGSSFRDVPGTGMVIERFVRRAKERHAINHHYKSIVRTTAVLDTGDNPHVFRLKQDFDMRHGNGAPVLSHPRHGAGLSQTVHWSQLRLNHYVVKSKAEFDHKKQPRGRATTSKAVRDDRFYSAHDLNDVYDPAPSWLVKATRQEMSGLRSRLLEAGCPKRLVHLDENLEPLAPLRPVLKKGEGQGRLESIAIEDGMLKLRGWALKPRGEAPQSFAVALGGNSIEGFLVERFSRGDVSRQFPSVENDSGLLISIPLDRLSYDVHSNPQLTVSSPDGGFTLVNAATAVLPPQLLP